MKTIPTVYLSLLSVLGMVGFGAELVLAESQSPKQTATVSLSPGTNELRSSANGTGTTSEIAANTFFQPPVPDHDQSRESGMFGQADVDRILGDRYQVIGVIDVDPQRYLSKDIAGLVVRDSQNPAEVAPVLFWRVRVPGRGGNDAVFLSYGKMLDEGMAPGRPLDMSAEAERNWAQTIAKQAQPKPATRHDQAAPQVLESWTTLTEMAAVTSGPDDRPVQLVVFIDPRCPHCQNMIDAVERLDQQGKLNTRIGWIAIAMKEDSRDLAATIHHQGNFRQLDPLAHLQQEDSPKPSEADYQAVDMATKIFGATGSTATPTLYYIDKNNFKSQSGNPGARLPEFLSALDQVLPTELQAPKAAQVQETDNLEPWALPPNRDSGPEVDRNRCGR